MPNAEMAVVDLNKLRDYCLSRQHPRGRHKALVFEAALGFTEKDAPKLRELLLISAASGGAVPTKSDEYGQSYMLDLSVLGKAGRVTIRSYWIVRARENFPRLATCFVR